MLLVAVVSIASVGYVATTEDEPARYGPLPTSKEATPRGLTWNVTPIDAPDEMPVYRLEKTQRSGSDAVRIATALGMEPDEVTYDASDRAYHVEDASQGATLTVEALSDGVAYHRDPGPIDAEDPPDLPSDDEARADAIEALEDAGLMPPQGEVGDPRTAIDQTVARCSSGAGTNATANTSQPACRKIELSKRVVFDRRIDAYPALGSNTLTVSLGDDGRVVELASRWAPLERSGTAATVPLDEALERAQAMDGALLETAPEACQNREITEVHLSYYIPARDTNAEPGNGSSRSSSPWAFPVYTFQAPCEASESNAHASYSVRISVPAVR